MINAAMFHNGKPEARREGPQTAGANVSSLMFHYRGMKYEVLRLRSE